MKKYDKFTLYASGSPETAAKMETLRNKRILSNVVNLAMEYVLKDIDINLSRERLMLEVMQRFNSSKSNIELTVTAERKDAKPQVKPVTEIETYKEPMKTQNTYTSPLSKRGMEL